MFQGISWRLAGILGALALSSCASAPANGVMSANEATYVAAVDVSLPDPKTPTAFAVLLHDAVVKEAALYGAAGRPIVLRIAVDKVHYKNALKAMIIGDDDQAKGRVAVLDQSSGQQSAAFDVQVDAQRPGGAGRSIAMGLIGAFDPTGLVDIGASAGSAASADINRSGTAAAMSANFATETLRQTFGDAKARLVKSEKQKQAQAH
jgi:hypothetical protein